MTIIYDATNKMSRKLQQLQHNITKKKKTHFQTANK